MSEKNMSFSSSLEIAVKKPDELIDILLPYIKDLNKKQLDDLVDVLDSANVAAKQSVANLFINHLDSSVVEHLVSKLDTSRPVLFMEIASILAQTECKKAFVPLKEAVNIKYPDLILPSIRAISMLPASAESDKFLQNFLLEFDSEIHLSASIRYLLARKEVLVDGLIKEYPNLDADRKMWILKFLAETGSLKPLGLYSSELQRAALERGLYCINGLGSIEKDESAQILIKHLNHPEWFLRKRIVEALGQTGRAIAIKPLIEALNDESMQVRSAAVESLSKVGQLAPETLIDNLSKSERRVKINLIRVMGQLKNAEFVRPLIGILRDRDALFFSIDALGDSGGKQACKALERFLNDEIWFNRLNALEALAKLSAENLNQLATKALQDENDMVRNTAARILAN